MRRFPALLALVLLGSGVALAGAGGGAAASDSMDRAWFRYIHGAEYSGDVGGECAATGVRLRPHAPPEVRLEGSNVEFTVFETWSNDTYLVVGSDYAVWLDSEKSMTDRSWSFESGLFWVWWEQEGDGVLQGRGEGASELRANLSGPQVLVEGAEQNLPAGVTYHAISPDGEPAPVARSVGAPARFVHPDRAAHHLWGGAQLLLDGARIQGPDGFHLDLPPHRQLVASQTVGVSVVRETTVYTHARLRLDATRISVDAEAAELACRDLALTVAGAGVYRNAAGRIERAPQAWDFARGELALSGAFQLEERLEEQANDRPWVATTAWGRIDAVGLDFQPLALAPRSATNAATVGLFAVLLASLAALGSQWSRLVGLFYSRFTDGGALRHPTRTLLVQLASERPGLILRDAVAQTGRPYGVVRHHVRVLETVGLVKTLRVGKALHLYPRGHSLTAAEQTLRLNHDPIVRFLVERAGAAPLERRGASRELQAHFGLSRMGAWKAVRRALASGLLRPQPAHGGPILLVSGAAEALPQDRYDTVSG